MVSVQSMMKSISLNDYLNSHNPWTKRLLGLADFEVKRDISKVEKEYNQEKYGSLLSFRFKDIEEAKVKEFELSGVEQTALYTISVHEELFQMKFSMARKFYYDFIKQKVEAQNGEWICELGCGYGMNLSYLKGKTYGGEYSANAVELAHRLNQDVALFNYYHEKDYDLIRENSVLFTSHSIEQLPSAQPFIEGLWRQRAKLKCVIHFEPTIVPSRGSLLGLLRNQYLKLNDYNQDLLALLHQDSRIVVLEEEHDVMGLNPLNSTNYILWKFK